MQIIFSIIIIHTFIYLFNRHNIRMLHMVKMCTIMLNSLIRIALAKHIIKCTTVSKPADIYGFHNKVKK